MLDNKMKKRIKINRRGESRFLFNKKGLSSMWDLIFKIIIGIAVILFVVFLYAGITGSLSGIARAIGDFFTIGVG